MTLVLKGCQCTGALVNSENPDVLLRLKQSSGTEIHCNLEILTCYSLKCKMDFSYFIVSACMG